MSPNRVRSQPSPRSAHGSWMMHVHQHDVPADPLPFVMLDTSPRPVGCSELAFRELMKRQRPDWFAAGPKSTEIGCHLPAWLSNWLSKRPSSGSPSGSSRDRA